MKIQVLYFAAVRERLATAQEEVALSAAQPTVESLLVLLRSRGGVWREVLSADSVLKYAVNKRFAAADASLADNDEVAIFPPMTGG